LSATRHCCHAITATATLRNSVAIETKGVTAL
jgi:hypothetical protein